MLKLGLTGSIGMGKTETARMFSALGVPVFDADAAVHALYAPGGKAVELVEAAFPGTTREGAVDRDRLSKRVLSDPEAIAQLEKIVHPLVREQETGFLADAAANNADIVVLDIPLLYETAGEGRVDKIVVVSAPTDIQRTRVMARPGMTEEKFRSIRAKQVPDEEKRARADFVIMTDKNLDDTRRQVQRLVDSLRAAMAGSTGAG